MARGGSPADLRFRAVRRLFMGIVLHILWWDVVLNRPLLRRFRPATIPRWTMLATRYVSHAERLGGVLIKLGQYVGARMDLLPPEVTNVLARLHDAVPPAAGVAVIAQVEADFGQPIGALYAQFDPVPIAAASLAQAHRALLQDGSPVVVKVLRPGIAAVVEADLAVVRRAVGLLRRVRSLARRADLAMLADEFTRVTRGELDCPEEGRNAERFAAAFRHAEGIRSPRIFWSHCAARTLTMEDVAFFRIDDVAGYLAQGVNPTAVARRLMDCCLDQIFRIGLVHADPHPGNLFIRPLPASSHGEMHGEIDGKTGHRLDRPFEIIFIDFGMVVSVPAQARGFLRTYATGIATRDAYTIVQSYVEADLLLPDVDLDELERMTAAMIGRFPSSFIGQMNSADAPEYARILNEHRHLVYSSPMKLKAELLFVYRAIGICAGTVAHIDPRFDPAECFLPLAERMQRDAMRIDGEGMRRVGLLMLGLPRRLETLLVQLERGRFRVRVESAEARKRARPHIAPGPAIVAAGGMVATAVYAAAGRMSPVSAIAIVLVIALLTLMPSRSR